MFDDNADDDDIEDVNSKKWNNFYCNLRKSYNKFSPCHSGSIKY